MIAKWTVRDEAFDQNEKCESLFREKEQLHSTIYFGSQLQLPSLSLSNPTFSDTLLFKKHLLSLHFLPPSLPFNSPNGFCLSV